MHRPLLHVFALLLVCLVMGCAGSQLSRGKPDFCGAESGHFVVYTGRSCDEARDHAAALERWLSALSTLGFGGFGGPGSAPLHLNVVMLSSQSELERYAPPQAGGYFVSELLMQPWAIVPAVPLHQSTIIKHELVHSIARQSIPQQPTWFAEGVATYFETAAFDAEGFFAVGAMSVPHLTVLTYEGFEKAESLFEPTEAVRRTGRFYASAWLLVHYLMSERSRELQEYQVMLAKGTPFEQAWTRAFPALTPKVIDKLLHDYFFKESFARFRHRVAPIEMVPIKTRKLSLADEYALQGILWKSVNGEQRAASSPRARAAFEAALRADPRQLQAGVERIATPGAGASVVNTQEARELALQHPEQWIAWAAYAFAANQAGKLDDGLKNPDPVAELERLAPLHPYTWILKARRYERSTLRDHAIRSAARAMRLGPQNLIVLGHSIGMLHRLKACPELSQAIRAVRQLEYVTLTATYQTELQGMLEACAAPNP